MQLIAPHRSRRLVAIATGLTAMLLCSLVALAGTARADGGGTNPFIQWHAAFSTGQTTNLTVGTVMIMRYVDPSSQTSVKQFCWSPAPIDGPACSPFGTGAPAQAGTQTVTAQLTNGQNVPTTFQVGPANTQINTAGSTGPWNPPVPVTSSCSISLGGDPGMNTGIGMASVGQQFGAYYQASQAVTQVYDYSTNQAGFLPTVCVNFPSEATVSTINTFTLKSNQTKTYTLKTPKGFKPDTAQGRTAIGYTLYRNTALGFGVGNPITSTPKRHEPFQGATITRAVYRNGVISVTVKTGRVKTMKLQLQAVGQPL
jgi:hypothetical protein